MKFNFILKISLFLVAPLLLFSACNSRTIYESYQDFDRGYWIKNKPSSFHFDIKDTSSLYTIFAQLRNDIDYPYYNIYLKYSLEEKAMDSISYMLREFVLMDPKTGKPFGEKDTSSEIDGFVYTHKVPLFTKKKFEKVGSYKVNLKQYMRPDTLEHVWSIGLLIEKTESNKNQL